MSRWFPDSLSIALAPDQVVVERRPAGLLGRARNRITRRENLAIGSNPLYKGWDKALEVLATVLDTQAGEPHADVTVILANSLVRYALVPQSNRLSAEQESAVLQHCFHELYGDVVAGWELRLSAASGMDVQPASGVDRTLLEGLRSLISSKRLRLRSIQPRLMAVCNEHRAALGGAKAWLLLVEPGNLCLGLIERGGLTRLRNLRCGENWAAELPWLLEREVCVAELDEAPGDVLLWHRDGAIPARLSAGSLRLHLLADRRPIEADAGTDDLAMAGG